LLTSINLLPFLTYSLTPCYNLVFKLNNEVGAAQAVGRQSHFLLLDGLASPHICFPRRLIPPYAEHCEYDQLYFLTQQEGLVCKAYHLDGTNSEERFRREQDVYREGKYHQLAQLAGTQNLQLKKNLFGLLFLKVPKRSLLIDFFSSLAYSEWLDLTEAVLDFIIKLQGERQVFLNIDPWSIFRDADGGFRLMDV
jgi:hypothetical protein